MRLGRCRAVFSALFFCGVQLAAFSTNVCSQEEQPQLPQLFAATKIDEFGRLGHCDLTARLDNFTVYLQSDPTLKGYVVANDSNTEKYWRASSRLTLARRYLVDARGLDAGQLVSVATGRKSPDDALMELWVVPKGAHLPFPVPEPEAVKEFTGKIDYYSTNDTFYGETAEMGMSETDLALGEFAEKMKLQPESKGYLVIRAAKDSVQGAWRRIARRDERQLQVQYGLDGARLKSIDAGFTDGEKAEVELWILPEDAPPPPGLTEKLERKLREAVNLDYVDIYDEPDEEQSEWALENLAELLREDPHARACVIARRYDESAVEEADGDAAVSAGEGTPVQAQYVAGADAEKAAGPAEEKEKLAADSLAVAEMWKMRLVEKYGIDAHRVFVMLGRPRSWEGGSVETWFVPSDAQLPDPLVVTEDEDEAVEGVEEGGEEVDAPAPQPPPE